MIIQVLLNCIKRQHTYFVWHPNGHSNN